MLGLCSGRLLSRPHLGTVRVIASLINHILQPLILQGAQQAVVSRSHILKHKRPCRLGCDIIHARPWCAQGQSDARDIPSIALPEMQHLGHSAREVFEAEMQPESFHVIASEAKEILA